MTTLMTKVTITAATLIAVAAGITKRAANAKVPISSHALLEEYLADRLNAPRGIVLGSLWGGALWVTFFLLAVFLNIV